MVSTSFNGWHEDFGDEPGIEERIPVVATCEDDSAWNEVADWDWIEVDLEKRETEVRDDRELG
jgi:hypothetical protein